MNTKKKHLFFDLDDTVTLSRSPIDKDMYDLMSLLPHDLVVITGAHYTQMEKQLLDLSTYRLGQNGNQAYSPEGILLWEEKLLDHHNELIQKHITKVRSLCTHSIQDEDDLIEHRGSQISFSILGHHENVTKKKSFDPDRKKRLELLNQIPFESADVEVRIGGTTCFDYFIKGRHKGFNVERLITYNNWDKKDCLYFGDALFPGGNDEAVIDVIETTPVKDHRHTFELLKSHFM